MLAPPNRELKLMAARRAEPVMGDRLARAKVF
jgi:hypothetical protein